MLGDLNTGNLLKSIYAREENGKTVLDPYGYFAEERHLDYLKGMAFKVDTIKDLISYNRISPFLPEEEVHIDNLRYRDYSQNGTIITMLKQGIEGDLVEKWNENEKRRRERDLYMTIDARLQMALQNQLSFIAQNRNDNYSDDYSFKKRPFSRASLVILNASGDLLCSANYPLPDQNLIAEKFRDKIYTYKRDSIDGSYTERDLGLTYQTQPGSTAKIMSAMAGYMQFKETASKIHYPINPEERVHVKNGAEPSGDVYMRRAIVESSNCYFVNLVHDKNLYPQLDRIYQTIGINVNGEKTYVFDFQKPNENFSHLMEQIGQDACKKYTDYRKERGKNKYNKKEKIYKPYYEKMNWTQCAMAWGQGVMYASPLNMARAISIVSHEGKFIPTSYLMPQHNTLKKGKTVQVDGVFMDSLSANELLSFLNAESRSRSNTSTSCFVGGKTGTPTREINIYSGGERVPCPYIYIDKKTGKTKIYYTDRWAFNDGWYVCIVNSDREEHGSLAIALRLEHVRGSGTATYWMKHIVEALSEYGYINK